MGFFGINTFLHGIVPDLAYLLFQLPVADLFCTLVCWRIQLLAALKLNRLLQDVFRKVCIAAVQQFKKLLGKKSIDLNSALGKMYKLANHPTNVFTFFRTQLLRKLV